MLKQQTSITVYRWSAKETNVLFPFTFTADKWKFAISEFCLQKKNGSYRFPLVPFQLTEFRTHGEMDIDMETWRHRDLETWRHGDMETWRHGDLDMETSEGKRKMEAQAIFPNPFTVCSSCNWKVVVCPFVEKKTHRSYPFAND